VPRVNNNDDEVKLVGLQIAVGERVSKGQTIAQVETDKAVVDVEADRDGFVLAINGVVDDTLTVGAVLALLGDTADEPLPVQATAAQSASTAARSAPTAKAIALLAEHGLDAAQVPAEGDRLSAADVERYLAARSSSAPAVATAAAARKEASPEVAGERKPLKSEERGMLATVSWHRDVAVPGYVEVAYDPALWEAHSQDFAQRHALLLNPLLPLMSWRLVGLARETPRLNATIVDSSRWEYSEVNVGFTVQAGDVLYLAVVRNAGALDEAGFVNALVDLQRRAAAHKLGPLETRGATIGFSSMARWKVSRHMPILPPHTALMVAHAEGADGAGVLGATYDHRVLNGADVASTLRKLTRPAKA
jgi:pyruvate/2-oxoglutarate dehydrogenase complex dihydrolipoamide acyltransferase (E2) component